ncbi:hypothetical protein OPT61_g1605 [Boeremia exigua]|uniref:Uncharacterized protein n=1 Tax=Boeremia exigua TaxID=749465 RepID=A0ACC2IPQ9_9PLEO|nr:hypothetical protein OPT61_g1605 [Boeremia exigua]
MFTTLSGDPQCFEPQPVWSQAQKHEASAQIQHLINLLDLTDLMNANPQQSYNTYPQDLGVPSLNPYAVKTPLSTSPPAPFSTTEYIELDTNNPGYTSLQTEPNSTTIQPTPLPTLLPSQHHAIPHPKPWNLDDLARTVHLTQARKLCKRLLGAAQEEAIFQAKNIAHIDQELYGLRYGEQRGGPRRRYDCETNAGVSRTAPVSGSGDAGADVNANVPSFMMEYLPAPERGGAPDDEPGTRRCPHEYTGGL